MRRSPLIAAGVEHSLRPPTRSTEISTTDTGVPDPDPEDARAEAAPTESAPRDPAAPAPDAEDPTPEVEEAGGFEALGLRAELVSTLAGLGYEEPTPIQREAIGPAVAGEDLLGQAATGTGKTAAFALPLLERLGPEPRGPHPSALVLVPTRELAIQVSEAVHRYGRRLGARVVPIYGGQPIFRQLRALQDGTDVVVATPGRAIDHLARGSLVLDHLRTVVLDEADEMLDMGFADDLEGILDATPDGRQTLLFSATLPARIDAMARRHLRDPRRVRLAAEPVAPGDAPRVRQSAYLVRRPHKPTALGRILDVEAPTAAIVFCRTRAEVDQLAETLNGRGYRAEALHGGMDQAQRDRVMGRLRSGTADLIVATDVAARGLDIDQLTHVVNYDVPSAPEAYVHRIGRVGRAGREGTAITLAEPREHRMLKTIERVTGTKIAVQQVPTVADLRARRLDITRNAIEEVLARDDLDHVRVVVESLSDEHDLMEIALAAVQLAHEATGAAVDDDEDLPPVELRDERRPRRDDRRPERDDRRPGRRDHGRDEGRGRDRGDRPGRDDGGRRGPKPVSPGMTRIYVNAGWDARVGPGDLVGAIAGESSLKGRDIGAIDVRDRFSLVEVPSGKVDEVIDALRGTTVRGRKVTARRERY